MTAEHEALGLFFHNGPRFYPGTPDYVWLDEVVDSATHVMVRYLDGAQVLYPLTVFDYVVMAEPK